MVSDREWNANLRSIAHAIKADQKLRVTKNKEIMNQYAFRTKKVHT